MNVYKIFYSTSHEHSPQKKSSSWWNTRSYKSIFITSCQHFVDDNQTDYDQLQDWPIVPRKYMHLINDQDIRIYKRMTEFSSCSQK